MSSKTILIIDDSMTVRLRISMILKPAGYNLLEASNGREGIEAMQSGVAIDMVLCDMNMPVADGLEFLAAIKADAPTAQIPVLMLTTDGSPDLIAKAKQAGAKGWIVKPFQSDMLLATVRHVAGDASA